MALIVTPGQLAKRAEFYFQLSAMIRAGLPVIKALENLERKPPGMGYAKPIRKILDHLQQGNSFSSALELVGNWMSPFDKALLDAGEKSGRLDECFKMLADYYEATTKRIRQVIGRMMYPVGLLHFALLIFPLDKLKGLVLDGNVNAFLMQKLGTFIPAYLLCFGFLVLLQSKRFSFWRSTLEFILGLVPFIGGARKAVALGRLTSALEALINAGVNIIDSWEMAAEASGSPRIERAVGKWRPHIESGAQTPGDMLQATNVFPDVFASIYKTGELSGQLDDALVRLREYFHQESERKMDVFTKALITLVVVGVMLTIGYFIISFYSEHFKGIGKALEGLEDLQ